MERTSPRGTLLLVEDDVSFAFCTAEFLARRGFEVANALDLDSALVLVAARRWAAVGSSPEANHRDVGRKIQALPIATARTA